MATAEGGVKARHQDGHSLASSAQLLALHRHLTNSLLKPVCPDIRLKAFDRIYSLHRIFLVQATFFNALLNGDFEEARAKKGVWKREEARSSSSSKDLEEEDNAVQLHFDDPNITRPAFEYCIATLYGAAPALILPSWCCPSPEYPLTKHFNVDQSSQSVKSPTFSSTSTNQGSSKAAQHPATPRFLLSLIASATYLGIPSVASQALTLILCSITPYTISQYLRFSLGHGILGAQEAQDRQEDGNHSLWDWELEGPLWGLESLSQECSQDRGSLPSSVVEQTAALSMHDEEDDEQIKAGSDQSQFSSSPSVRRGKAGSGESFLPSLVLDREEILSHQGRFYYGAQSDKIGEVCSCWLLRWGADVLLAEEGLGFDEEGHDLSPYISTFTLPRNSLPIAQSFTSNDDLQSNIAQALTTPQATVWCHPKMGGIPACWVRNIISSDSFWIRSEWDRYDVARRVVAMRRGCGDQFVEADDSAGEEEEEKDDKDINSTDINDFKRWEDTKSSKRASISMQSKESSLISDDDEDEEQYSLLFSEGIYYTHMTFEELSAISNQVCPSSGSTYVPMTVLQSALWAQSELKNTVLTKEKSPLRAENLEEEVEDANNSSHMTKKSSEDSNAFPERRLDLVSSEADFATAFQNIQKKGRKSDVTIQASSIILGGMRPLMLLGAAASKAKALENLLDKRFFAVPSDDTVRIGENLSSLINASSSEANVNYFVEEETGGPSGLAAVVDNHTVNISHETKRATLKEFFGIQNAVMSGRGLGINYGKGPTMTLKKWTGYEPMRLGAEFYGVDRLKERERMYSPSFFYAGSIWNLYLQVVKKPKGLQVGIYLHRQNCNDSLPSPSFPSDLISDETSNNNNNNNNTRGEPRTPRRREGNTGNGLTGSMFYTSSSPVTTNAPTMDTLSTPVQASTSSRTASASAAPTSNTRLRSTTLSTPIQNSISLARSPTSNCIINSNHNPQYLDERPILRAYFSVHCPSPLGTSLTKFSSQPDDFALNQSWGWKSSSLLGAVYLADNKIGTAESQVSSMFRCIVTVGVV